MLGLKSFIALVQYNRVIVEIVIHFSLLKVITLPGTNWEKKLLPYPFQFCRIQGIALKCEHLLFYVVYFEEE